MRVSRFSQEATDPNSADVSPIRLIVVIWSSHRFRGDLHFPGVNCELLRRVRYGNIHQSAYPSCSRFTVNYQLWVAKYIFHSDRVKRSFFFFSSSRVRVLFPKVRGGNIQSG